MKMKEFGPRGGHMSLASPWIRYWVVEVFFVTVAGLRGESLGCEPHRTPSPTPAKITQNSFNFMLQLSVNDTLHSKSIVCHIANLLLKDSVKSCKKKIHNISQSDFPALTIHVFNILPSAMVSFSPLMLKIVTFEMTIVERNL